MNGALEEIKSESTHFNVISREYKDNAGKEPYIGSTRKVLLKDKALYG